MFTIILQPGESYPLDQLALYVSSKGLTLPSEDIRQIVLGRHAWTPGANGRTRTGGLTYHVDTRALPTELHWLMCALLGVLVPPPRSTSRLPGLSAVFASCHQYLGRPS